MANNVHIDQRLCYDGALCTVRYIGSVEGTQKDWLGVEWDDTTRGKHDGAHAGKRYFTCRSNAKSAASFIRPSRKRDSTRTFVQAVYQKYATEELDRHDMLFFEKEIAISGKVVEEVGFDKIRAQMQQLHELKIILVDDMRVDCAEDSPGQIVNTLARIVELDLSRNLFEHMRDIWAICHQLDDLKVLKLDGNRFSADEDYSNIGISISKSQHVTDLSLDQTLLSWEKVGTLMKHYRSVRSLSLSANEWTHIPGTMPNHGGVAGLTALTLEFNAFCSLSALNPLTELKNLQRLFLKGNNISNISTSDTDVLSFNSGLHYVDLSYNTISSWAFVDDLTNVFPGMTGLRVSHNPFYVNQPRTPDDATAISTDEVFMLTLARLPNLSSLNFSDITTADRTNAEMFYLSRIGKAIADVPEGQELTVISQHRRYRKLCELHGGPVVAKATPTVNPNFLEARLIRFTLVRACQAPAKDCEKVAEIPRGFDVYQMKGIVGKLYGMKPKHVQLIWETGEWDPVANFDELNSSDDEDEQLTTATAQQSAGEWVKREVELEDGTRQVGFLIDGMEARVRVENRQRST